MGNLRKVVLSLAVFLLAFVPLVLAQGTYTQIDYPGASATVCWGIDSAGDITGSYLLNSYWHGFLLSGGKYATIDFPGALHTYVFGINDVGQVLGGTYHGVGFLYALQTQTFTKIRYPGAHYTWPTSIDDAGTMAGYFKTSRGYAGFELIGSTYSEIAPRHASVTFVTGIIASGKVVGTASIRPTNSDINFSFDQGKYREIEIPNAPAAHVIGVNSAGTAIVGSYQPSPTTSAGFVFENRSLQTLQFPGLTQTAANGINGAGVVVGDFLDSNESQHGFTWTPPADAKREKASK